MDFILGEEAPAEELICWEATFNFFFNDQEMQDLMEKCKLFARCLHWLRDFSMLGGKNVERAETFSEVINRGEDILDIFGETLLKYFNSFLIAKFFLC